MAGQRPPKARLLPDKYNGSTSCESFLAQFDACSRYNHFDENDKLAHLCWCLSGQASQILWQTGSPNNLTYDQLAQKLKQRFGNEGQEERYRAELRTRKRKPGENLQLLHQDIRRLMSLGYPGETSRLSELIAKDSFLSALNDPPLELKCREHEPKDLDSALKVAMRFEQYQKVLSNSHSPTHVNRQLKFSEDDPVIQRINALEKQMQILKQQKMSQNKGISIWPPNPATYYADHEHPECCDLGYSEPFRGISQTAEAEAHYDPPQVSNSWGHATHMTTYEQGNQNWCTPFDQMLPACPANTPSHHVVPNPMAPLTTNSSCNRMLRSSTGTGKVYVHGRIAGQNVDCLLDSGSEITSFPKWLIPDNLITPTSHGLHNVNGKTINLVGETDIACEFGKLTLITRGVVSNGINEVIFGKGFLSQNKATWDFASATLHIAGIPLTLHDHGENPACYTSCHVTTGQNSTYQSSKSNAQDDTKFCPRTYLKMCLATLEAVDASPKQQSDIGPAVIPPQSEQDVAKTDDTENHVEMRPDPIPNPKGICETNNTDLLSTSHHFTDHGPMPKYGHESYGTHEPVSQHFEWLPKLCNGMSKEQREWCTEYPRDLATFNSVHEYQQFIQVAGCNGNGYGRECYC